MAPLKVTAFRLTWTVEVASGQGPGGSGAKAPVLRLGGGRETRAPGFNSAALVPGTAAGGACACDTTGGVRAVEASTRAQTGVRSPARRGS